MADIEPLTPGTPLPWASTKARPRKITANGVMICTAVLRNMGTTAQNKNGKAQDAAEANAAYIVVAANAYPVIAKLEDQIEALGSSEMPDWEIEEALRSEGIFQWGPDAERFERMFAVIMGHRRAALAAAKEVHL